jgi:hypothetical protein
MSLTVGEVVFGTAARLLKQATAGGIIAAGDIVADLRDVPALVEAFQPLDPAFVVPGADGLTVATYLVPPPPTVPSPTSGCCTSFS